MNLLDLRVSIQWDNPTSALRETLERRWVVPAAIPPPLTRWSVVEETSLTAQQVGRMGGLVVRETLLLALRVRVLDPIQWYNPTSALRETLERWWANTAAMLSPRTRWRVVEETSQPAQ